jgi:hypothetical protein
MARKERGQGILSLIFQEYMVREGGGLDGGGSEVLLEASILTVRSSY